MNAQKIARRSLVDSAIDQLRATVESGEWPVGERIPNESRLSELLGVGRNTVREAVRVLVHAGLLETLQGDGTYVRARLDPAETMRRIERSALRDQLEMRITLEAEAARLAALRRDQDDLDELRAALAARAAAGDDIDERIAQDERFHVAIAEASHNHALMAMYAYFRSAVSATIERTERDADLPEPSHADHEYLLATIIMGDAEAAFRVARTMLMPALDALSEAM